MKELLSQKRIEYTDRDITTDKEALAEMEELGYRTTPVTVIDGEVAVGFNRERLEELLTS